jgi:hypothetical protein
MSLQRYSAPPPIIGTAVAAWVFLLRNFRHALWLGWPFFLCLFSLFVWDYYLGDTQFLPWAEYALIVPGIAFAVILLLSFSAMCAGWMRAVINGVSKNNFCHPLKEWKIAFCMIAQMIGIDYFSGFIALGIAAICLFLFYGLSLILPEQIYEFIVLSLSNIPTFLIFYYLINIAGFVFIMGHCLYLPARATGRILSNSEARKLLKGLRISFFFCLSIALFPLFALPVFSLEFIETTQTYFSRDHSFYLTATLIFLCFIMLPYIFCGVLSGYYLWVRKHRMKNTTQTKVPDDPFSDEGWEGPIWEDFR